MRLKGGDILRRKFEYFYDEENHKVSLLNMPDTRLLQYTNENKSKEYGFEKLFAYILHRDDLKKVFEYTVIYENNKEQSIKEAVFNTAMVTFIRCFTKGKEAGRIPIKINDVASRAPEGDIKGVINKFETIRNKFIAHDQDNFQNMKLGVIVNDAKEQFIGICCLPVKTKVDYLENILILRTLTIISLEYVEEVIDKEYKRAQNYFKSLGYELIKIFPEFEVMPTSLFFNR